MTPVRYDVPIGRRVTIALRLRGSIPPFVTVETLEQGVSARGPRSAAISMRVVDAGVFTGEAGR